MLTALLLGSRTTMMTYADWSDLDDDELMAAAMALIEEEPPPAVVFAFVDAILCHTDGETVP
ncbi:hypothetical protein [Nocardiopsis ansamitocini]|uniref:hypothetical protein n=1 Tax=Nocardiopsis ansamitocini TaxID=1670832 RepID=UPI002552DC42|nr:hypothetical protein [Nocardiopsis ansamitocini]